MSASSASRLLYFFTYNPSLGGELNPHDKILFFHSASERSIDARNQLVGLSEALVNFALSFTGDVPCECVRTNQKVFCIRQFDDEVWTVVVAKDPLAGKGALDPPPYEADLFAEFLGNTVDLYHDTFKFFYGFPKTIAHDSSWHRVREILTRFSFSFIPLIQFDQPQLLPEISGVELFPLDSLGYLSIHQLISALKMKCSSIESVAFFHKRKVVYHIFPPEELKVLNNISKIGPVEFFNALMDSTEKSESSSLFTLEIFSAKDANAQSRRLFLLQKKHVSIVVTTAGNYFSNESLRDKLCLEMKGFLRETCKSMLNSVPFRPELQKPSITSTSLPRYLYFNHLSMTFRNDLFSTAHPRRPEELKILQLLRNSLFSKTKKKNSDETFLKSKSLGWFIGRRCLHTHREFYLIIPDPNLELSQVTASSQNLSRRLFASLALL